ncbi:VOC family protein [Pseudonocardia broussonetiae]|uniref:VOC family protein n=1 Tax=Pseudonocardia broussonetiae TaxID=2736640 RepID=A0A6M6JPT3_9PSEU|nr:VOC family protein [Pseudonocardia broussonetiae]QJY48582.1 VOC family protein [Pseudonocardia broussonetiae]
MSIDHVLSVLPVSDIDVSRAWYERLFGRAPDNTPMPPLAEWRLTEGGWVQVWVDAERAGRGLLNLAVDDLPAHVEGLRAAGLEPGEVQEVTNGVTLSALTDPDGNTLTFIGSFHVDYPA